MTTHVEIMNTVYANAITLRDATGMIPVGTPNRGELLAEATILVQSGGWYFDIERFKGLLIDALIATSNAVQVAGLLRVRDAYTRWDSTVIA